LRHLLRLLPGNLPAPPLLLYQGELILLMSIHLLLQFFIQPSHCRYIRYYINMDVYILAWEPSIVQDTQSYSRRLPALGRKLRFYFFLCKSRPTQLRILKQVVLSSSPIKIWGKSVKWLLSYDRTYKQTEISTLYS